MKLKQRIELPLNEGSMFKNNYKREGSYLLL